MLVLELIGKLILLYRFMLKEALETEYFHIKHSDPSYASSLIFAHPSL